MSVRFKQDVLLSLTLVGLEGVARGRFHVLLLLSTELSCAL
jgi:hypothetical protein